MQKKYFGTTKDGQQTSIFTYKTKMFELGISDYGSSLVSLIISDKNNIPRDIVLGYDDVAGYETDDGKYFGANVGRNANRIADAKFVINGQEYKLDKNDGENNLHSGFMPYSKRVWKVEEQTEESIKFILESPHMDQGYPGNMKMYVTYKILSDDSFEILYEATPDADTILNVTNHSYFNLNGEGNGDIYNHMVTINADYFTPSNERFVPTGEITSVENTPMDFRKGKLVAEEIDKDYIQLINASGYDHNWITDVHEKDEHNHAADGADKLHNIVKATGDISGITINIATDYPGVQFYTGNFLNGVKGKKGHVYENRSGMCFEPQFYPNAINMTEFPSPICKAGEVFRKRIVYSFEV